MSTKADPGKRTAGAPKIFTKAFWKQVWLIASRRHPAFQRRPTKVVDAMRADGWSDREIGAAMDARMAAWEPADGT